MKWIDVRINAETIKAAARRTGKTALNQRLTEGYFDWVKRGSPPDEEIPDLTVVKIQVE